MKWLLLVLLTACCCLSADTLKLKKELSPFIQKHCVSCHGPKKEKGDFRIDRLSFDLKKIEAAEGWQMVLDELNGSTMPPEDEPQPKDQELIDALERLTFELEKAKVYHQKPTPTVIRRLNKREYINSIYELTGVLFSEKDVLPDQASSRYDTHGQGLYMSAFLLDRYKKWANDALEIAMTSKDKSVPVFVSQPAQKHNENLLTKIKNIKSKNFNIKLSSRKKDKGRDIRLEYENYQAYLGLEDSRDSLVLFPTQSYDFKFDKNLFSKREATYNFNIQIKVKDLPRQQKAYLVINDFDSDLARYIDVTDVHSTQETLELSSNAKLNGFVRLGFHLEAKPSKRSPKKRKAVGTVALDTSAPKILIQQIKLGQHNVTDPEMAYQKIFSLPKKSRESEHTYASRLIENFAYRAYRYEAADKDFLKFLNSIFRDNLKQKKSFPDALKEPLAIILSSPRFLYHTASLHQNEKRDRDYAEKLATFLWSTPPDEELLAAADRGDLQTTKGLQAQLKRMLEDSKSNHLAEGFMYQWLELEKLNLVDIKTEPGPKFYSSILENHAKREAFHFFRTLAIENLSINNFVDSDFVTVNNNLAQYYGLNASIKGEDFQKVALDKNSPRGGLLGQAIVLTMTSNGDRSSPVYRGNFALTHLMGLSSPPPPPNVPDLPNKQKGSIKEKLAIHQQQPQCASCHKRIDPMGFALESFDHAGQWLGVTDRSLKRVINGHFPDGTKYNNYFDYKEYLKKYESSFQKAFVKHLCSYALQREMQFSDQNMVDQVYKNCAKKGVALQDLIFEIISLKQFQKG